MQSLYDGGAEKLLVDMLNNFDYSKYDIDLLLEHDFGNYANLVPLEVRKIILFYNINRPLLERMIGQIMSYFGLYYFYILFQYIMRTYHFFEKRITRPLIPHYNTLN